MNRPDGSPLPAIAHQRRNVLILAAGQALSQSVAVMVMTVGGLVGYALAADKGLATLPVAAMFVGTAAATVLKLAAAALEGRHRPVIFATAPSLAAARAAFVRSTASSR